MFCVTIYVRYDIATIIATDKGTLLGCGRHVTAVSLLWAVFQDRTIMEKESSRDWMKEMRVSLPGHAALEAMAKKKSED
jgi:hypothetical protein